MSEETATPEDTNEESVNELSVPSTIDLEAIIAPVSEESPSGEYMRYAGIYDEVGEARRADDDLSQGDWQTDLKTAEYQKVLDIAVPVLEKETKDIQIAAWVCEALAYQHGFAGLRDSFRLMIALQENFWETLHPEIDEGDMEGRANALAWMDRETALAIKRAPITEGEGYGFIGYEDSKRFDFPENTDSLTVEERENIEAQKKRADEENRVTAEKWEVAVSRSKRAFYEKLEVTLEECWASHKELNAVIEKTFDPKQAPGLPETKKALDAIQSQTNKLLEMKRLEEPDPADEEPESETTEGGSKGKAKAGSGAIQNRRDALRKLTELSNYFRRTEPHSPVSYLVNRAVKWGNMPLDNWLEDVVKDQNILAQLRQTLGFNTESADPSAEVADETPPDSDA